MSKHHRSLQQSLEILTAVLGVLLIGAGLHPARATDVCGEVCDETWPITASPYTATCHITVPAGWAGRRIVLQTDYVNASAVVFLDGQRAGAIKSRGGEVDLTTLVRPGQNQTLSVLVRSPDAERPGAPGGLRAANVRRFALGFGAPLLPVQRERHRRLVGADVGLRLTHLVDEGPIVSSKGVFGSGLWW